MALADLNRSNDTPIATLLLASITPKDYPTLPAVQPASPRIYVPVITYNGGLVGDDVDVATSNATDPYSPRNQTEKAALMVPAGSLALDVARPRGTIAAYQRYPVAADAAVAAPTITSLAPNTAVAVTGAELVVTITGTGFTQWSTVRSGGYPIPSKYVDATHLTIYQNPKVAVAGTVQVIVTDHDVDSAPSNFVFT
jgi:hypothetical protein